MIEINNLNYSYNGQLAIKDLSLRISKGEKVALVGPNGAGKTTLLLHINGILRGKGFLKIAGMELNEQNLKKIRSRVGLVFQSPDDQLFSASVYGDVAYGLIYQNAQPELIRARVTDALATVDMTGFEKRSPIHLSLGEKKRVALATVLSMQPEILALDEPTSGLDPRGRRTIINLLKRLDQTILVATHDMALVAELFPRVIIMDTGGIVYDGETKKALADHGLLELHGLAG